MSLRIEIRGDDKEKIAREIEKELREKYGERIGDIKFYSMKPVEIARIVLPFVEFFSTFLDENSPEYPLIKGLEAGLKEYLKYSERK